MKVCIVDPSYETDPSRFAGIGASWLRWQCEQEPTCELVSAQSAEVILVTFAAPHEFGLVAKALRRLRIQPSRLVRNRKPWVFMGGGIGLSPAIADDTVDATCVGEGVRWIKTLLGQGIEAALHLPESRR